MTEVLWTRSPRVMAGSGSASSSSDRAKAASSSSGSSTGRNRSGDYPDFENLFSFLPGSQLLGKWYVHLFQECPLYFLSLDHIKLKLFTFNLSVFKIASVCGLLCVCVIKLSSRVHWEDKQPWGCFESRLFIITISFSKFKPQWNPKFPLIYDMLSEAMHWVIREWAGAERFVLGHVKSYLRWWDAECRKEWR